MKKGLITLWLLFLFGIVAAFFYHVQWVYGLPTPVPENYRPVAAGSKISIPNSSLRSKPLFIHFFNPDCPCSKFNVPHFRSLVKKYGKQIDFVVVPLYEGTGFTDEQILTKLAVDIPVIRDTGVAAACGVYSTPQAVIITPDSTMQFRGNYNRSRYCADKKTEYARLALEALVNGDTPAHFDSLAFKAYGCKLPLCSVK